MKTTTRIIKAIRKLSKSEAFRERHVVNKQSFTRNRKLSFSDTIMFVLSNLRTVLPTEVYNFCKQSGKESFSVAAISKAKEKISHTAFKELLQECNNHIEKEKNYHGYEILAVDGMKGELPKTSEFMRSFGQNERSGYPIFHSVATYDVLNHYYKNGLFRIGNANERELARASLEETATPNPQIYLYDRGFPEIALLQMLFQKKKNFVMRISKSFLRETNDFAQTKLVDKTVHITYDKRRAQTNTVTSAHLPYEFDLRMVRIKLNETTEEILITNLPKNEFPKRYLKELYRLRWGIESSFNELKNSVVVEEFLSKKENTVQQEFYATLILYNLTMCMVYQTDFHKPSKKNEQQC